MRALTEFYSSQTAPAIVPNYFPSAPTVLPTAQAGGPPRRAGVLASRPVSA